MRTEYRKEHVVKVNIQEGTLSVLLVSPNPEFYSHRFSLYVWFNMDTRAILEELSNQRMSKKIGNGEETKETEPDVLQRQRKKGANG